MFKSRIVPDLPAPHMGTNHDQFEAVGQTWTSERDWLREEQLARNPKASTVERRRAVEFTQRHATGCVPVKPRPRPAFVEQPREIGISPKTEAARLQREVHKLVMQQLARVRPIIKVEHQPREKRHVFVPAQTKAPAVLQAPPKVHVQDPAVVRARKSMLVERQKLGLRFSLDQACEVFNLFGSWAAFEKAAK